MAKLIYAFKLYLFQGQEVYNLTNKEKENLERFVRFGALLYVKNWVEAPICANAASNDLTFWKEAGKYSSIDEDIAKTTQKALQPHLWYLSDELIGLSLLSKKVSLENKVSILSKMSVPAPPRMIRGNSNLLSDECELADFANSRTMLLFDKLNINNSFLNKHPSEWEQEPEFKAAKNIVNFFKVVNDIAERGVKLFKDFNKLITNDEEEKQLLLQIVEANRKQVPTEPTKKAVLESLRKPSTSKDKV